jgi:hypothetical protein
MIVKLDFNIFGPLPEQPWPTKLLDEPLQGCEDPTGCAKTAVTGRRQSVKWPTSVGL